jgi:hypothetical protein
VEAADGHASPEPVDAATGAVEARPSTGDTHGVEVTATTVHIHGLTVERPAIVKYLESIAPAKQEIALIHALEVGVTELIARRQRFKQP